MFTAVKNNGGGRTLQRVLNQAIAFMTQICKTGFTAARPKRHKEKGESFRKRGNLCSDKEFGCAWQIRTFFRASFDYRKEARKFIAFDNSCFQTL